MKIKTWQYIVIGLLALGAVGLLALDAWLTPYDLAGERAAARAAGLPLSAADLPRQPPPVSQNAAADWNAFANVSRARRINEGRLTKHKAPYSPAAIADIRRLLHEHGDLVARIHRATDKPHAYWEHTYEPSELFPHYAWMRKAATVLRSEAALLFHEGRVEEAVATQARGLRIAQHAASDPVLIAHLVSLAVESMTLAGFEDMLVEAGPDARVAGLIRRALDDQPVTRDLNHAMRGEVLFGLHGIREMRSPRDIRWLYRPSAGAFATPSKPGSATPLVVHYVARQGEAAYLKGMTRLYQAWQRPTFAERKVAVEQVVLDLGSRGRFQPPADRLTAYVVPVYTKVETRYVASLANRRVLRAACNLMAYRARTDTWPATLEQAGRTAVDPFTDTPLGYRREGKGFVLYSVGADGTFAAKPGQDERGQAVFHYAGP